MFAALNPRASRECAAAVVARRRLEPRCAEAREPRLDVPAESSAPIPRRREDASTPTQSHPAPESYTPEGAQAAMRSPTSATSRSVVGGAGPSSSARNDAVVAI